MDINKEITENVNQLKKLLEDRSCDPSERTRDEEGSESRYPTDQQQDPKPINPLFQRDNQTTKPSIKQGSTIHLGTLDFQSDIPRPLHLQDQQQCPKFVHILEHNQDNPKPPEQNDNEPFQLQSLLVENEHLQPADHRQGEQQNPDYTLPDHQEEYKDVEEDADPSLSVSDQPERQSTDSERQPTDTEREPTDTERQPTDTECQPTNAERQQTDSARQQTDLKRQPTDMERQVTDTDRTPRDTERQPAENTEPESLIGSYIDTGLATEHEPVEDEDESYRRMMSVELGKRWRDGPETCTASWSIESSLIESGYSESRSAKSCRKCDLAENMFLCPESRSFWKKVRGNMCCKRIWKDFLDEIKSEFPGENALNKKRVLNMLRSLLGVQNQELSDVTIEDYLKFIGFFGPFRHEDNRCVALRQLEYLVENSSQQSKNKRSKICWFAGYMTRREAEEKLADQEPGTYLVRMTGTGGMEGCFVASLVMKDRSPEHFQIKGNPEEAVSTHPFSQELEFKGQQFSSLPDLVNNFLRQTTVCDPDDPENGVRCRTICPGLPFNHLLDGYK